MIRPLIAALAISGLAACGSSSTPAAPSACTEALDAAEAVIGHAVTGMGYMPDVLTAIGNGDIATIQARTTDLNDLTPVVEKAVARYNRLAETCRDA